jgi:hypothetical protein
MLPSKDTRQPVEASGAWIDFRTTTFVVGRTPKVKSAPLVWLAVMVVLWHTYNFFGFGAIDLEAGHTKYQGRCRQAEAFGFECDTVDLSCKALASAEKCH